MLVTQQFNVSIGTIDGLRCVFYVFHVFYETGNYRGHVDQPHKFQLFLPPVLVLQNSLISSFDYYFD